MTLPAADLKAIFNLEPKAAIAYLQHKGYKLTWNWQEMLDDAHARAFTIAKAARLDVVQDIRNALDVALRHGQTLKDFQKNLKPTLQAKGWWGKQIIVDGAGNAEVARLGSPWRLATIYRTNLQSAFMAANYQEMAEATDSHPYWQYVAVLDGRTRPSHRAMNGRVFRHDDPIWNTIWPPNGFNCFPAETPVRAAARLGLKTWYAGKVVELQTRLGHRLTLTANHPVLTVRGWIAACQLQKGDQLIGDASGVNPRLAGVVNDEQPPARAEDLFQTLAAQGFRIVPMAPHDFHGDAGLRKPEIHIAGPDVHLMDEVQAAPGQFVGQQQLRRADACAIMDADRPDGPPPARMILADAVAPQNPADVAEAGAELAADGAFGDQPVAVQGQHPAFEMGVAVAGALPGGGALASNGGGVLFDGSPFDALGFRAPPQGDVAGTEQPAQGVTAASGLVRQLLEANAGLIALDEIVQIRQFDWAGHVYDFETETGLIMAGGVIVHNCRCRVRPRSERSLARDGIAWQSSAGKLRTLETDAGVDKRTGEITHARRTGIDVVDADGKKHFFAPDAGFNFNPGQGWSKPFTPPPLDTLPKTFSPGQVLPDLPKPEKFAASMIVPDGLGEEDYAKAFLAEFGADLGKPVVFQDVTGDPMLIDEALFKSGAGEWKATKDGRGPYMRLLAHAIRSPDEIWMRSEESRERPGTWLLKRRYLKTFEIDGHGSESPQYGLSVFEYGSEGWSGSTAMISQASRGPGARRRYIERQRDGFLLFRR